jgi:hypothetical protein
LDYLDLVEFKLAAGAQFDIGRAASRALVGKILGLEGPLAPGAVAGDGHQVDFESRPLGGCPRGEGVEGEAKGFRHHSGQGSDAQPDPVDAFATGHPGLACGDSENILHQARFMHNGRAGSRLRVG